MLTVSVKVILLASRMGSLTQVEFTKGDVVSQCDVYLCFSLQPCMKFNIHNVQRRYRLQYGYRMGKAALHIAGVTLARDFKQRGIPVGLIHPGVVRCLLH